MRCGLKWAAVLLLATPGAMRAQQPSTGTVTGTVTEAGTGRPVPAAQVQVVGTSLGALTNDAGQYTIRGVPARTVTVRVLRVGFNERTGTVAVTAGGSATLDLQLSSVAVALTPVVTTATGEQRRVEVPSAIAQVDAANLVQERQISNVGELLTARAPGVQVLQSAQIGAGSRIRIRGTTTLNLNNDPIVFIDGVRADASSNRQILSVGGTAAGALNDLNPDEIENIEVVRGPSASVLYGTDAANGVIVITTKRGRAGRTTVNAYTQQALQQDKNPYPDAVFLWGRNPTTGAQIANSCSSAQVGLGQCTRDSVTRFNPYNDPRSTPLRDAWLREYGVNVSGGTAAVRYFVSGELQSQDGTNTINAYDRDRAQRPGGPGLRAEWLNPNRLVSRSGRANVDVTWGKATVGINANYIDRNVRFPQNDNNVTGIQGNALFGPGRRNNLDPVTGDSLLGWNQFSSLEILQEVNQSDVQRFIGSIAPRITPTSWLTIRANAGLDFYSQTDDDTCLNSQCVNFGTNQLGFRSATRGRNFVYDLNANAAANWRPFETLGSTTTIGAQWVSNEFNRNGAFGENLPPGALTVSQAAIQTADEATTVSRTQGAFLQQELAWRDKLFFVASVRADNNSAFGRNFKTEYYPGVGASWVASEESFFPFRDQINQFRVRVKWGQSGNRPGTTAALPFFQGNTAIIAGEQVPGLFLQALGNADLRPATVSELEYGIDFTAFDNRLSIELTQYDKRTTNDLIQRILPPSYGTGATNRFENIGAVRNWGTEYLVNVRPVQFRNFGWDFSINGSYNSNELEDLGDTPPIIGSTTRQIEGYPLNGYWARPYTYSDANNDGIIVPAEVRVAPADSAQFRGYSMPRNEIVFQNGFDLFENRVRVVGQLDYKGGYRVLNLTERFRCTDFRNSFDRNDPDAPLDRQARCVAAQAGATQTFWGYMEDATFLRLRELSVSARFPESWTRNIRGVQSLNLTFAARNLALWSDWTGIDPEANYGQGNTQNNFLTQPPLRTYALRVNVGF